MRPLKVTAHLQAPVVGDFALPLDGILYYMTHRNALGAQEVTVPGAALNDGLSGATMPLARCEEHGPMWYYAASWAQWPADIAQGSTHWNKRLDVALADLVDFAGRRGSVDISSGRYKSYHMPIYYRHATELTWYAFGVLDQVRDLLLFVNAIGKKCEMGWGAVRAWRVEEIEQDWSVRKNGKLMRAIPSEAGILHGFRPSYWLRKNQTVCEVPER